VSEQFELKPLSRAAAPAALAKAEKYRFLNEPRHAESICTDVLASDPDNQGALVTLVLAISDQLERRGDAGVHAACEHLARVADPYARAYYEGIVHERRAYSILRGAGPAAEHIAYEWFRRALGKYEEAERLRPPGNEDAILRWNTIVRVLQRNPHVRRAPEEPRSEPMLE
jgi:hypothetical protein